MVAQVVGGVIGGANDLHVKLAKNAVGGQIVGKSRIRALPDGRSRFLLQHFADYDIAMELEMRPVINRIAQRVRDGARPCQELFVRRRISGDVSFGYAVGAHGAPLVVIAFEPDLGKIGEAAVFGDVFRGKMAVVVEDRLRRGVIVIESPGDVGGEQKIFAEESGHGSVLAAWQ